MHRILLVAVLALASSPVAWAALTPAQIAIIANSNSRESQAVARYYAKIRNVPVDQICLIDVPAQEVLDRQTWDTQVRPAIRSWLQTSDRASQVRCLVTVYDVPLKIDRAQNDPQLEDLTTFLRNERAARVERANRIVTQLQQLAAGAEAADGAEATDSAEPPAGDATAAADPSGTSGAPLPADAAIEDLRNRIDQAFTSTQSRVGALADQAQQQEALNSLRNIYVTTVGLNMVAESLARQLQASGASNPNAKTELDFIRGRTRGLRESRVAMENMPQTAERDQQILAVIQASEGLLGSIAWIDDQLQTLTKNETYSSFDSELSLVLWPQYELVRWQPNYLSYRYEGSAIRQVRPTMMVARLDGPDLRTTRRIMDEALQIEEAGLTGKVYLDARGIAKLDDQVQPGTYGDYDRALLQANEWLTQYTDLQVVLDNKQELLQPGSAPDAALYCGWYSLAKYVDAFEWNPGAVGYHLASSEASTLRNAESQVWCKRMLEDGVCATIGPVYEPYLSSFPKPNEFMLLLLSGRYSLVECYYRTLPFNSWNMLLIGDPLYTPYKNNSPLKLDQLPESLRQFVLGSDASVPSDS